MAATEGKAGVGSTLANWEANRVSFYDYNSETWVTPSLSDEELQSDQGKSRGPRSLNIVVFSHL